MNENIINNNEFDSLMDQIRDVINKQNQFEMDSYDFSFYQEKRYRLSEKLEDILPETKRLALNIQRKLYKFVPEESVQWLNESPDLIHDWDGELHIKYLKKAEKLLEITDYEDANKILGIIF